MPRIVPQLRARIIGALLLTSAVTLIVAAVALTSPLEQRLRGRQLTSIAAAATSARRGFEHLPPAELRRPSGPLRRQVEALRRRAGAQVALVSAGGRVVFAPGAEQSEDRVGLAGAARAAVDGRTHRAVVRVEGEDEALVAVPLRGADAGLVLVLRRPLSETAAAVHVVRAALVTASLAGLAVAILVGALLATRLVRRLRRLREAAVGVAERGPEAEILADRTRDEVGDLARAFAEMQRRLREQEEARRTFVSTASHELRTPLASLELMLDLLGEDLAADAVSREEIQRQVVGAQAHTRRLSGLAAQLLDLSRVDAGVPLRSEPLELKALSAAVVAEFEAAADERGLQLRLANGEPTWAVADPGASARIVRILLDNALRASPAGGLVEVTLGRRARRPTVTVRDEGIGVPADERAAIFGRFYRGSSPGAGAGFGLGLALGRELAQQMHGELRLEESDRGAAFTLVLPPALERAPVA